MFPPVALTGAKGTIGTVLREKLTGYSYTPLDLPECDLRDKSSVLDALPGHRAVVHLAWHTDRNLPNGSLAIENLEMTANVLDAALRSGVPRVILASSVHADDFFRWDPERHGLLSVERQPVPTSPYGASKVFAESLGAYYAQQGLEVICLRLGGVNPEDQEPEGEHERAVWLRHADCVSLFDCCLSARRIRRQYALLYAVSDNPTRRHDWHNSLGWEPALQGVARRKAECSTQPVWPTVPTWNRAPVLPGELPWQRALDLPSTLLALAHPAVDPEMP
jgi:hypothetical protein